MPPRICNCLVTAVLAKKADNRFFVRHRQVVIHERGGRHGLISGALLPVKNFGNFKLKRHKASPVTVLKVRVDLFV